jgi:hypothetical protein
MVGRVATATVLGGLLAFVPASAAEVVESLMQVSYEHGGTAHLFTDTYVPLLPGNACYTWYIRLAETNTEVTVEETLTLPIAIDWGPNQDPQTEIRNDGRVAVTTLQITSDTEGWVSRGWCVAQGDPTGSHLIEVSIDGQPAATFPFEVLAADAYTYPPGKPVPERALRSANNTW